MKYRSSLLCEADGRALAVALLRDSELIGGDDASIEEQYRDGKPQNNFVLRYLEMIRKAKNEAVERGFSAVLSDFISGCYAGGVADVDLYERLNDEAI